MTDMSMPHVKPHPLKGESFVDQYVRTSFLSSLCTDYAESAKRLVSDVLCRKEPHRGSNGEALLTIVAARDVERIARAVQKTQLMPDFLRDIILGQLTAFRLAQPNLVQARDVIEHVDEYIKSAGRKQDHWFDMTSRYGPNQLIFRIGGTLDMDMIQLVDDSLELAQVVKQTVTAWFAIEMKFRPYEDLAKQLLEHGVSVRIEVEDSIAIMTILESSGEETMS
jgi:hypothetical protein